MELAVRAFEVLLGWSLLLQTLEYLRLIELDRVSHWPAQRSELPTRRGVVRDQAVRLHCRGRGGRRGRVDVPALHGFHQCRDLFSTQNLAG